LVDLTAIIQAAIALIAAGISTFLIPWLKGKTTESQWNMMVYAVQHGVQAAEQLFSSGQGQQKKQYVLDYLKSKGFTVDDAIIESTVNSICGKKERISGEFAEVE
jgi:hypothetical protein